MVLKILRKRKNVKAILWALAIILIPAFVLWGAGSAIRGRRGANYAGIIFGKKVSIEKYLKSYNAVKTQAIMIYGTNINKIANLLNLEQQAWDRLILLTKAERKRIKVTDDEVVETISKYPFFRKEGKFDKQIYNTILSYVFRIKPRDFEEQVKDSLKIQKLIEKVLSQVQVSDEEVKQAYKQENEKVKVSFVLFKPSDFLEKVEISEEKIKQYFKENNFIFKKPPQVNIKYIPITYTELEKNITIPEDEIKQYYETNKDEFKIVKSNKEANQKDKPQENESSNEYKTLKEAKDEIIKKLKLDKAKDEVDRLYVEILDFISQKSTLEDIAEKFKLSVKETGFFSMQGSIPGIGWSYKIARKAFELKVGKLSDLIETPDGYYLIQVKEKKKSYIPKFDEVKQDVVEKYRQKVANQLAEENAKKMLEMIKDKIKNGQNFADACGSLNLEVKSTKPFSRIDYIPELGKPAEFINTSFNLEEGKIAEKVVPTTIGFAIIKLDKFIPIDEEEFKKKEKEYKKIVLNRKKQARYINWLNQAREQAELKSNLDKFRKIPK